MLGDSSQKTEMVLEFTTGSSAGVGGGSSQVAVLVLGSLTGSRDSVSGFSSHVLTQSPC